MVSVFKVCVHLFSHRGNSGLWLGDGNMLRDGAWSDGIQSVFLHPSGLGLGGFGRVLPNSWRLFLGRQAVLAAAWLALLHAGGAGGHSNLSTTHCTLNRTTELVVRS